MKGFIETVKIMWEDSKVMTICGLMPIVIGPLAIIYAIVMAIVVGF